VWVRAQRKVLNVFFEFFLRWVPEMDKSEGKAQTSREKKQKKQTKRVVSFGAREHKTKVFGEWKSALCSLSLVLSTHELKNSLSKKKKKKKKKASYSPRALLFSVSDSREKKKCSPPRKHDPPWSVPPLPFDRRDLPPKFDRRRLESERWKVRVIFLLSFFSSAFFLKCVVFWRERAQGRDVQRDCRSERCIDDRKSKRERWWWRFPICFLDLDLYRSLFLPLMMMREKKKRFWERDGASFLP
jgi:hypothetical protein